MSKSLLRTLMLVLALLLFAAWQLGAFTARKQAVQSENQSGGAAIGGRFELIDHHGKLFSSDALKGKFQLVYFGYTYCPDVCPAGLMNMTQALEVLGASSSQITPLFISVDPERDTTDVMAEYVEHFHPSLIGLTGTQAQVDATVKAYKVYYALRKDEGNGEDYLVDHSAYLYLMDKQGRYLTHFTHETAPEEMAAKMKTYLEQGE